MTPQELTAFAWGIYHYLNGVEVLFSGDGDFHISTHQLGKNICVISFSVVDYDGNEIASDALTVNPFTHRLNKVAEDIADIIKQLEMKEFKYIHRDGA